MRTTKNSERILGRRVFLKALSAGIAAPLALRMGGMAMAEPSPAPVRLFIFYVPHGMPVEHFEPIGAGPSFLAGSEILAPLAPFAGYVNVVRGLSMAGATNHGAIRAALTGSAEGASGNSIDYTIAQALGVGAHALGAIPYDRAASFSSDSFLIKHGSWVRPTESPIEAAAALLGNAGSAAPPPPEETEFRKEVLGLTERQVERMHASLKDLTGEQNKLSVHLEALRALKAAGDRPVVNGCTTAPALPAVDALRGKDVLAHESFGQVVEAHLEVAANALLCGAARVVTMQNLWVNSTLSFGFAGGPGIAKGHHDPVSHAWDAAGRAEFAQCQRWFYEELATKLLRVLDQPDPLDPGNTALHNTLIYVCSEVSDGANHNSDASEIWVGGRALQSYLPAVLIGGAGGRVPHREIVDARRTHLDMLATLGSAMGVPLSSVGGQSATPIQELLS